MEFWRRRRVHVLQSAVLAGVKTKTGERRNGKNFVSLSSSFNKVEQA